MDKLTLLSYLDQIARSILNNDGLDAINLTITLAIKVKEAYKCGVCDEKINEWGVCTACKQQLREEIVL